MFSLRPKEETKTGGVHAKMNQIKETVKPRQHARTLQTRSDIQKKAKTVQGNAQYNSTCDTVKVSKERHSSQLKPKAQSSSRGQGQFFTPKRPKK